MASPLIPLAICLFLYAIYKWVTQNNNYFKDRNIPHLKPQFIVGNTGGLFMNKYRANEYILNMYNKFPSEK